MSRVAALDIIRGVAVLGILAANIPAFGLPEAAYFSPAALGTPGTADLVAWGLTFVLVEGKMRGLFTMLFGASMLLVIERAETAGDDPAKVHYSRMAWLFVFGMVHLYGFWWGDILTHYALVGCIAYGFRRLGTRSLILLAIAAFAIQTIAFAGIGADLVHRHAVAFAAHAPADAKTAWQALASPFGSPTAAEIARETLAARGGFSGMIAWRWETNTDPFTFVVAGGFETLGYILSGMVGLRSGFLRGTWKRRTYARIAFGTLAAALPLSIALAGADMATRFDPRMVFLAALPIATPLHVPMVLGYAALVILCARSGGWWTMRFAAAGRMALSNYLLTTLLCTTLFYGYGFGLFGHVGRAGLYGVVALCWALMLASSKPWLDRHRYGPFEWLWRSLARLAWQPMKGAANATDG